MNERIRDFLAAENKSSAQLAEEIGVQPSGISHILSGRNNPSLDFILKMLEKYQFLSTDWLLFGKGTMYKENKEHTLFDDNYINNEPTEAKLFNDKLQRSESDIPDIQKDELSSNIPDQNLIQKPTVKKIVWFYDDNSFVEYFPKR